MSFGAYDPTFLLHKNDVFWSPRVGTRRMTGKIRLWLIKPWCWRLLTYCAGNLGFLAMGPSLFMRNNLHCRKRFCRRVKSSCYLQACNLAVQSCRARCMSTWMSADSSDHIDWGWRGGWGVGGGGGGGRRRRVGGGGGGGSALQLEWSCFLLLGVAPSVCDL